MDAVWYSTERELGRPEHYWLTVRDDVIIQFNMRGAQDAYIEFAQTFGLELNSFTLLYAPFRNYNMVEFSIH